MKRKSLILTLCILATGVDARAQDITAEIAADASLEAVGATCVALAVFAEARGASFLGQALVASVVLNRQAALPHGADACDAIRAPVQFPNLEAWGYPRAPWEIDRRAWDKAREVAVVVASGDYYIPHPFIGVTAFRVRGALPPEGTVLAGEVDAFAFYKPIDELAGVP